MFTHAVALISVFIFAVSASASKRQAQVVDPIKIIKRQLEMHLDPLPPQDLLESFKEVPITPQLNSILLGHLMTSISKTETQRVSELLFAVYYNKPIEHLRSQLNYRDLTTFNTVMSARAEFIFDKFIAEVLSEKRDRYDVKLKIWQREFFKELEIKLVDHPGYRDVLDSLFWFGARRISKFPKGGFRNPVYDLEGVIELLRDPLISGLFIKRFVRVDKNEKNELTLAKSHMILYMCLVYCESQTRNQLLATLKKDDYDQLRLNRLIRTAVGSLTRGGELEKVAGSGYSYITGAAAITDFIPTLSHQQSLNLITELSQLDSNKENFMRSFIFAIVDRAYQHEKLYQEKGFKYFDQASQLYETAKLALELASKFNVNTNYKYDIIPKAGNLENSVRTRSLIKYIDRDSENRCSSRIDDFSFDL